MKVVTIKWAIKVRLELSVSVNHHMNSQWSVDRPGWVPVSRALVYKTSWADGRALYSTTRVLCVNHKSANLIIDLQLLTGIQVLYGRQQNILPWSQLRSFILPLSRLFARPRSKNCLILIFVLIDGMRLIFFPLARAVWRSYSDLSISSSLDPPPSFLFLQSSFVIFLIFKFRPFWSIILFILKSGNSQ